MANAAMASSPSGQSSSDAGDVPTQRNGRGSGWLAPGGLVGSPDLIRVGPSFIVDESYSCPAFLALKARPDMKPRIAPRARPAEMFALKAVMETLDRVEHDETVALEEVLEAFLRDQLPHPGLHRYVTTATHAYLRGAPAIGGGRPVRAWWVVQHLGDEVRELYAWGRRYETPDRRERELLLLRFGSTSVKERDPAQVAIAAYVAAFGAAAAWPKPWREPFRPVSGPLPDRVIVSEVGLADGERTVLFDGTPRDAASAYQKIRIEIQQIVAGGDPVPGGSCVDCKAMTVCGSLPRIPGVLGIGSHPGASLRKVSVSDLRYYRDCPAQWYLRALHLPRTDEYGDAARVGLAVHAWLGETHRLSRRPCTTSVMPSSGAPWAHSRWRLTPDLEALGAAMLAHHPEVCPNHAEPDKVDVERTVTFHDSAAQVIVIAKPDLLYLDAGSWIWREVKTTSSAREPADFFARYPQLALATVLLAKNALGGRRDGCRVELELLRPGHADIIMIDPLDPRQLERARQQIRDLALPWRTDTTFPSVPGRNCQTCPVSHWCPSALLADELPVEGPDE